MAHREGNLEAPTRHPLDWKNPVFYDKQSLFDELERVYDLCHGCRRCNSLCAAFPTLFDLVDESSTMEVDGVDKNDYWKVVDHCYLCDLCYNTKCPYTPPHEWNIDFPHLMLRAKAVRLKEGGVKASEKVLANTDAVGKLSTIPVVVNAVNSANKTRSLRKLLDKALGVHPDARLPVYDSKPLRKRLKGQNDTGQNAQIAGETTGKVAIFATCFGNYNEPDLGEDLVKVLRHSQIQVRLVDQERCCGMPKLELGDLEGVAAAKEINIPALASLVDQDWDIIAPVPSCVLMFRQELPLMFPDDEQVKKVANAIYD
ncbi:MAG: heterodisulfide reductase-related iron-sulfur binding cluster, partial [Gammaproteobacteria bacterium]